MAPKKTKKVDLPVLSRIRIKESSQGEHPVTLDGFWADSKSIFLKRNLSIDESFFYRDLSFQYEHRHKHGKPDPYDCEALNASFSRTIICEEPYQLKAKYSKVPHSEMDKMIRFVFHLDPEIDWRLPEPGERVYHRPDDGYVGVWMEHLRSDWSPRCHIFMKHLFKYEYGVSPMQVTLNGIKWVTWFLAACNHMNYFPTFKLFHQLFTLAYSNKDPYYEIRFRGEERGYGSGDDKPVIHQSSLKGWNKVVIFLKGLDLGYMTLFAERGEILEPDQFIFEGEAKTRIHEFCECLDFQMTRDAFMNHKKTL